MDKEKISLAKVKQKFNEICKNHRCADCPLVDFRNCNVCEMSEEEKQYIMNYKGDNE